MVPLEVSQETNTCPKLATETLEITEYNPNENIIKKQPPVVFYKKSVLKLFTKFIGKHLCINLFNLFFNEVAGCLQLY